MTAESLLAARAGHEPARVTPSGMAGASRLDQPDRSTAAFRHRGREFSHERADAGETSAGSGGTPAPPPVARAGATAHDVTKRMVNEIDELEAQLIDRAKRRDPEAWDALVSRYLRRVLSIAWGIVRNAADAEDLAQDAFVRGWERIDTFQRGRPFGPWIYSIVTRMAIDVVRRRSRFPENPVEQDSPLRSAAAPDRDAISSEIARRIDTAIESLPEMQGIVARLWLVEQFDYAEIAEMTGLAEGTIRSHLSLARARLRDMLGDLR